MWWKYSVHVYVAGKMRAAETIPGTGEGEIKENDGGVNSTMRYFKKFYKCHSVPPTII
jgi:hypothetical protein